MRGIIVDGNLVDYVVDFKYVKYDKNTESYINCDEKQAEGYIAGGYVLDFPKDEKIVGGKKSDIIPVDDIGHFIFKMEKEIESLKKHNKEMNGLIIDIINSYENKIAKLENTIVELVEELEEDKEYDY